MSDNTKKVKLTEMQAATVTDIRNGWALRMSGEVILNGFLFNARGYIVKVRSATIEALVKKDIIQQVAKEMTKKGTTIRHYELTELGKTIEL